MDPDPPSSLSPRKVKFAPKGPPRRKPKPIQPKTEVTDEDDVDDEATQAVLRRLNQQLTRRGPKVEKKSSVQVAFGDGVEQSTSIRTYGKPKEGTGDKSNGSGSKNSVFDNEQNLIQLPSTARTDENAADESCEKKKKKKKEYKEPWDYHHSDYPITLPLRRPYSGNPALLDEAEFGKAAANLEYDDSTIHSASELGLLEENDEVQMLFFQLPQNLPLLNREATADGKQTADSLKCLESEAAKGKALVGRSVLGGGKVASAKGKEIVDSGVPPSGKGKEIVDGPSYSGKRNASKKGCSLEELPGGYMGKMLVYKSGTIKLKLGETLYDVSPGTNCIFPQDVVAISTTNKHCCMIGELNKRAVVTPDVDSLLDSVTDLGKN